MAWDFMANSVALTELADEIEKGSTNFDTQYEALYTAVGDMGASWKGEDYDLFKEGCEGYRTALEDLSSSMMLFSHHFDSVADATDTLARTLTQIICDLTEFSAQGGSATDGTTEGTTGGDDPGTGGNADDAAEAGGDDPGTGGNADDATEAGGDDPGTEGDSVEVTSQTGTLMNSGDAVTINGESYNVYGYVNGPDGRSVGIYADGSGCLYSMDASGTMQAVTANSTVAHCLSSKEGVYSYTSVQTQATATSADGAGTIGSHEYTTFNSFVIDGVEYKIGEVSTNGYSEENVVSDPSGTHNSYTNVTNTDTVSSTTYSNIGASNYGDEVVLAQHTGGNSTLAVPGNSQALYEAVQNQQPIKLQSGHTITYDYTGPGSTTYGGNGDTYFIYHDGYYYESDSYGNILDYSSPLDPSILDGSGYFNDTVLN